MEQLREPRFYPNESSLPLGAHGRRILYRFYEIQLRFQFRSLKSSLWYYANVHRACTYSVRDKQNKFKREVSMIKGAKSIAEYAIRKWILEQNLAMDFFILTMDGNVGKLSDQAGDSLKLVYDSDLRTVYIDE